MINTPRLYSIFLAALLGISLSQPARSDEPLDQGKQRLGAGDPLGAYTLLEPLEAERSGEPAYDLLLGLAALDSGKYTRAIFALERVLAVEPGNARARAEIARAYLLIGENRAAREEFEKVKQQDIPPGVTESIDHLLAMILRAENRNKPSLRGHLELTAGTDSNVNSSTDATTVAVPALGIATLNANSVQTSDTFATLAGGLAYRHPVSNGHFLTGNLNASIRQNQNDTQFDTSSVDGSFGWQFARGKNTVSLVLAGSSFQRDSEDLRDTASLNAQWQHDYTAISQATLFFQYIDITYPGQEIRDVDRVVLGAGYAQAVRPRTVVFGSLYGGAEMEKADNVQHLGHKLAGVRLGTQHRLDDKWSLLANVGYEGRRYGGLEPLFTEKRSDDQLEASLGLGWQFHQNWRIGARASYIENDSNIPVFEYTREVYSINLRLDF